MIGNFLLNVETWRIANKTVWQLAENSTLTFGVSYEEQDLYHPIVYSPFFSLLIDTEQRNTGANLRYQVKQGDHDLLAGLNYGETEVVGGNYTHFEGRRRDLSTEVDNEADSLEVFIVDRWQFAPQWTAVYGAQVVAASREVRNTSVPSGVVRNPKDDYNSVNPRAGLIYQLSDDIEIFANLSKLYEAPTNFELEDDARANNETLDAMQGIVFEIGTRGSQPIGVASQWHWDVAVYYAQLKDEILSIDEIVVVAGEKVVGTSLTTKV